MSNRNFRAQQKVIEQKIGEMFEEWVERNPLAQEQPVICEDKKTYRGIIKRWLEPLLPGKNKVLVEEALGDSWTLRFEEIERSVIT